MTDSYARAFMALNRVASAPEIRMRGRRRIPLIRNSPASSSEEGEEEDVEEEESE